MMKENKYKVLIIACWGALIFCFIIKLFGGNFFEPYVNNDKFIAACNWLDDTLWAKCLVSSVVYCIGFYLVYLAMIKKRLFKDWWYILLCLPCSILKGFNAYIGVAYDIVLMIVIPLITTKAKRWKQIILGFILVAIFQLISLFTRDIGWYLPSDSMLILLIMQIDYYIMIVLYYLYSNSYNKKVEEVKKWVL